MTPWSDYALTVIVQVSVVSLVALVMTALSLHSPARRHAIGVLGLVLILSSPLVALLLPQMDWWRSAVAESPPEPLKGSADRAALRSRPIEAEPPLNDLGTIHVEGTESVAAQNTQSPPPVAAPLPPSDSPRRTMPEGSKATTHSWTWRNLLVLLALLVWLTGSVVSAGMWIRQRCRLRRLVRSWSLADGLTGDREGACFDGESGVFAPIAREVCAAVGLRKLPPVVVSPVMPIPVVLGVFRPLIVIPRDLLLEGASTRLRDVLIHEAAHVARRDAWINMAQRLASILWWWHPGVLGLNRVIARSREEVCDNFVLSRSDASQYAQTLLEFAEKCAQARRVIPSLGLLESRWTLESRIRGLLKPGRETMTRTTRRTIAMITVVLGAVCFALGGVRAVETEEPKEAQPPQAAATSPAETKPGTRLQKVVVRGQCVNDKSEPLANVRVLIVRRSEDYSSQALAGETKSDAEGRFELRDVETAMLERGDLFAAAALEGYVSACVQLGEPEDGAIVQQITLPSNPGTLSGVVRDPHGQPIPGVTVYLSCVTDEPLPGIRSSVTDQNGRYAIPDLKRWTPEGTRTFDPKTGTGTIVTACNFLLRHPDYPKSMAQHSAVPQEVNVTLHPPALVEGQVIDAVTNKPAANVTVSAQGVARGGWFQTRTDEQGRYRLRMTRDHYNIWADAKDRIAVAVNALNAEQGETVSNADIRLVRGGFVVGTVFDAEGKPISPNDDSPVRVAHYGPARPRTGAAVTSTLVQPDGSYRLRVAPGRNYVYSMSGSGTAGYVTVDDGEEVTFDIRLGEKGSFQSEDEDQRLARKLREAARREDAEAEEPDRNQNASRAESSARNGSQPMLRQRPATRTGKLLDELAEQNASTDRFRDEWARTLKEIVDLGPEAVPDLIAELDATDDNMMLRCLGFTLRAIGDKRAVPALIRAIPKTLLPPGSDMGLRAEDESLAAFMQRHDLHEHDKGTSYSFGRPVREIFGALHKLTDQSFGEEQLFSVFASGTAHQQQLKQELFARTARKWAEWWEQHWRDHLEDVAYSRVNLPKARPAAAGRAPTERQRFKTGGSASGWILGSYADPKTKQAFYDLDTGRAARLPQKWRQAKDIESHLEEIEAWAAHEGFDLMGTEYASPDTDRRFYALRPIGLQAWELGQEHWNATFSEITFEDLQAEGTPAGGMLLDYDREKAIFDPEKTVPFLFRTREGTPGLLFVGVEVRDDSLKPGGIVSGDTELQPTAFSKGRRFGWTSFEELPTETNQ